MAIISVENKGSDTYRIEGTTDTNISSKLFEAIKPYNDEMIKLLEKAKKIIKEASSLDIDLKLGFNIDNAAPKNYKDVIFNRHELENLKKIVKNLEKEYLTKKSEKSVSDLEAFLSVKEEINGINVIISITTDYEVSILKQITDALANKLENSFVLLANVGENSINIIAKSNSDKLDCGLLVKELAIKCNGNGGGNKYFAQGGGSNSKDIATYLNEIKDKIKSL